MTGTQDNPETQVDPGLLEGFKTTATAIISDNLNRLPGAFKLRPFYKGGTMVGTALTVRTAAGDNLFIHMALELVRPRNVLVVDGSGDESRAGRRDLGADRLDPRRQRHRV